MVARAAREDMMTWKIPAANKLAVLLAATAVVAIGMAPGSAEPKRQFDERGRPYYGSNGPNVSYQQGRIPASTSPSVPGSMPASKSCPATANSPTMRSRRRSPSRARTRIARSTASR